MSVGSIEIWTVTKMAREISCSERRVNYVIALHHIHPTAVAGNCRIYDAEKFKQIREAVASVKSREVAIA